MATDIPAPPDSEIPIGSETTTTTEGSLSPDTYVYTTPSDVENFGSLPYNPPNMPKHNLDPPPSTIESKGDRFCKSAKNQNNPYCKNPKRFCTQYPNHALRHDESDPYKAYGFFTDVDPNVFIPELRNPVRKENKKPINNLYETKQDNIQLDVPNVQITKCRCKDGRVVRGYVNMRNGQKDCSNCQTKKTSYPNAYKNYKTKPKVSMPRTDIHQPLRKQVGVSHFGDVNMKGCSVETKTGRTTMAENTLNRVVNISNDAPVGSTITQTNTTRAVPKGYSLYDDCPNNVFGV